MILIILIACFLLFMGWILFAPVMVSVDTDHHRYRVMLPGVVNAGVVPVENGLFRIRGWIFFIPFSVDPFRRRNRKKNRQEKKKKKGLWTGKQNPERFKRMVRAIRIRRMELDLDTDDFVMNAWLVPLFSVLNNYHNIRMQVNFEGHLSMVLDMRTRIGILGWTYLTNR